MTGAYRARAVGEKSPPSQAAEFQFALSEGTWETLDGFLKPPEGHHLHGLPERGAIGIITRARETEGRRICCRRSSSRARETSTSTAS